MLLHIIYFLQIIVVKYLPNRIRKAILLGNCYHENANSTPKVGFYDV